MYHQHLTTPISDSSFSSSCYDYRTKNKMENVPDDLMRLLKRRPSLPAFDFDDNVLLDLEWSMTNNSIDSSNKRRKTDNISSIPSVTSSISYSTYTPGNNYDDDVSGREIDWILNGSSPCSLVNEIDTHQHGKENNTFEACTAVANNSTEFAYNNNLQKEINDNKDVHESKCFPHIFDQERLVSKLFKATKQSASTRKLLLDCTIKNMINYPAA